MKPPPPRLPARGKRHRQREAGGDRRIDRIAAAAQNIDADRRRRRLLADDHPVFGAGGRAPRECMLAGARRTGSRRGGKGAKQQKTTSANTLLS